MKLRLFILFFLSVSFCGVRAQVMSLMDDCNPMVRSLEEVVYVVRADYALQDEEENLYGQNGQDYFGLGYGPAIMIDGNLVISENTYKPYLTDTSYKSYGSEYAPVTSDLYYKHLQDKSMTAFNGESEEDNGHVMLIAGDSIFVEDEEISMDDSMACVLVTFVKTGSGEPDEAPYRLSYLNNGVEWDGNDGKLAINKLGSNVSFALLFYEVIGQGQVNYVFGGFVEEINDEWSVFKYSKLKPLKKSGINSKGRLNKRKK